MHECQGMSSKKKLISVVFIYYANVLFHSLILVAKYMLQWRLLVSVLNPNSS